MQADSHMVNGWTTILIELKILKIPNQKVPSYTAEECRRLQKAFGYSYEEVKDFHPEYGEEWCGRNGSHGYRCTACGIIRYASESVRIFSNNVFAQVTNPPIDAIRERGRYIHNGLYWRRW